MLENDFVVLASKAISQIADNIILEDPKGIIDINFVDEMILYVTISTKQFVITGHTSARQIWVVSPISGPHHFSYINNRWLNRNKQDLLLLIHSEINQLINFNVHLNTSNE
ncbi:iron donor protein CyaY [Orientia chuto str. Dubai]|uniref:Iron donor protein CyaY n=1 Tax=Orientia chuto str. Dubai TaxID=1359168 RepID=A0A0F3MJF1_9RICK|nr:iron donor protein CyaY [Candidatus Orientia mediorientalis]KJV55781.1 iron donor protein CyaY [Orientia chuto str. Dubai]